MPHLSSYPGTAHPEQGTVLHKHPSFVISLKSAPGGGQGQLLYNLSNELFHLDEISYFFRAN